MSDYCEFSIDDNGLKDDLVNFYRQYPDEAVNCLKLTARQFNRDVNAKFPDGGTSGGNKAVKKKWKVENERCISGLTYAVDTTNYAPVFHLVEYGHELWLDEQMYKAYKAGELHTTGTGKSTGSKSRNLVHAGYVPGKYYCAETREEYKRSKFQEVAAKKIHAALSKHGL